LKNLPAFLLIVLGLIWGSSFILIKLGLQAFSPIQLAFLRIAVAGWVFIPFIKDRLRQIKRTDWKYFVLASFLGNSIPAYLFSVAEVHITSSLTGALNSLTPLFTLIIGILLGGVVYSHRKLLGILIACTGAVTLLFVHEEVGAEPVAYEYGFLVVVAAFCYGANINLIHSKLSAYKPLVISMVPLLIASAISTVGLFFVDLGGTAEEFGSDIWKPFLAVVVLAVFGNSISLTLFNRLIQLTTPVYASLVTYIIPIVATVIGFLYGEYISVWHVVGLLGIILGIRLINK
jgi:drug/metabolite transporter (DMT)-like permease